MEHSLGGPGIKNNNVVVFNDSNPPSMVDCQLGGICHGLGVSPYEAMMDEHDPGITCEMGDRVYAQLTTSLPLLLNEVLEKQRSRKVLPFQAVHSAVQQRELCEALMKQVGYPSPDVEAGIVSTEANIDPRSAADLVRLAQAIRRIETGGLREVASTRVLIAAGRLMAEGLSAADAAKAAVAAPLTDDIQVGTGLRKMIELYLANGAS